MMTDELKKPVTAAQNQRKHHHISSFVQLQVKKKKVST